MSDLTPAMRDVGEILHRSIRRNFKVGGRPKWKPSARVKAAGGVTLTDTGRLKNSMTVEARRDRVSVGTNVVYARIHQFGGKTKARTIKPRIKKALFWPGAGHPVSRMSLFQRGVVLPSLIW
ncbi:MAG: phage virion morphogenesis protein [Thermodesulfobacteriota bacterium]